MTCRRFLVLFDLDGTLLDSAPDLAAAANALRRHRSLQPLPCAALRECCGKGARGLVWASMRVAKGTPAFPGLEKEFLEHYRAHIDDSSRPFAGVPELLEAIAEAGGGWGIVTNKHSSLAGLLCERQGFGRERLCLVGGDMVARSKPFPDPLLLGMKLCGCIGVPAVYVGDDARDMAAARAAGLPGIAASWGYTGGDEASWGADAVAAGPGDVLAETLRLLGL